MKSKTNHLFFIEFVHCVGAVPAESDGIPLVCLLLSFVDYGAGTAQCSAKKRQTRRANQMEGLMSCAINEFLLLCGLLFVGGYGRGSPP